MQRKTILVGVSIFVVLFALTAIVYLTSKPSFRGALINPPWPAPEINLTDHNGQPVTMSSQKGKVVLLYFGYVNCPDECPLTMAHVKLARESLGNRAKDVQVMYKETGWWLGRYDKDKKIFERNEEAQVRGDAIRSDRCASGVSEF